MGITPLKLTHLEVSASIWVQFDDPRARIAGGAGDSSPIFSFLDELIRHQQNKFGSDSIGLPSTLKTLTIRDRYHLVGRGSMHARVREACQSCTELRQIDVTLSCKQNVAGFLAQFGSNPITANQGTTPLRISTVENCSQVRVHGEPDNGTTALHSLRTQAVWKWAYVDDPEDILEGYKPVMPGPPAMLTAAIRRSQRMRKKGPRTIRLENKRGRFRSWTWSSTPLAVRTRCLSTNAQAQG